MSTTEMSSETTFQAPKTPAVDYKFEVAVLPVSDVDRAKQFYTSLGWREDTDVAAGEHYRLLQFTPPGSQASVIFGKGVAGPSAPLESLILAVYDIEAARGDLVARGVDASEVFHGSAFDAAGERLTGRDPDGNSYASWVSFRDPDGNGWLLQEIKTRLPGR